MRTCILEYIRGLLHAMLQPLETKLSSAYFVCYVLLFIVLSVNCTCLWT